MKARYLRFRSQGFSPTDSLFFARLYGAAPVSR